MAKLYLTSFSLTCLTNSMVFIYCRPVSLFSQEDIASKRNSLNHTQQRPASVTSPMANNSNFIEELKLATKSSTLRRTSTAGIGPGESQGAKMVFSSTNGPVVNGIADKSKGVCINSIYESDTHLPLWSKVRESKYS